MGEKDKGKIYWKCGKKLYPSPYQPPPPQKIKKKN